MPQRNSFFLGGMNPQQLWLRVNDSCAFVRKSAGCACIMHSCHRNHMADRYLHTGIVYAPVNMKHMKIIKGSWCLGGRWNHGWLQLQWTTINQSIATNQYVDVLGPQLGPNRQPNSVHRIHTVKCSSYRQSIPQGNHHMHLVHTKTYKCNGTILLQESQMLWPDMAVRWAIKNKELLVLHTTTRHSLSTLLTGLQSINQSIYISCL